MNYAAGQVTRGSNLNSYALAEEQAKQAMLQEMGRQPEIPRYGEELEKNLHVCSAMLDQLEAKLSNLTYCDPPSPEKAGTNQIHAAPQTAMGRHMQEMSAHASNLHQRISSLVRRLEV